MGRPVSSWPHLVISLCPRAKVRYSSQCLSWQHIYRLLLTVMLIPLQDTLLPMAARKPCARSLVGRFCFLPRESPVSTAPQ